jgi:hypothetical protein
MESPEETEQKLWVPQTGHITGWAITDFFILKGAKFSLLRKCYGPALPLRSRKKQRGETLVTMQVKRWS